MAIGSGSTPGSTPIVSDSVAPATIARTGPASLRWPGAPPADTLMLQMSEDAYSGDAQYTVSVNGTEIGGVRTETVAHSSGHYQIITLTGDFGSAPRVAVTFINDYYGGRPALDRNLYVNGYTYDGISHAGAALLTDTTQVFTPASPAPGAPIPPVGSDTLVLDMSEDAYLGDAQFTVSVNGHQVGGVRTVTALRSGAVSQPFTLTGAWGPGPQNVVVSFLNDAYAGPGQDRNLFVDNLIYDGQRFDGAAQFSGGASSFTVSAATGSGPGNPASVASNGTGPDQVVLTLAEDAYVGDAQYTVSVNGAQVGGTRTETAIHALGQSETLTLNGSWGATPPTVTVDFLNDRYDGTAETDRNLYVDQIAYKGSVYAGAVLASGGAVAFKPSPPAPAPVPASDTLVLDMSEDAYLGDAQFTVSVNGHQVGGVRTVTALRSGAVSQPFTLTGAWGPGPQNVVVSFLNDAYAGPGQDRNLFVDNLIYDGQRFDGAAQFSGGASSFTVSAATGSGPGNPASVASNGTGPDQVVLTLAEDAYVGDAQYTVSVNGVQVGGTRTETAIHALGQSETLTLNGSWGATPPAVTVDFLNDRYDGTAETDRNLYVDQIAYKGSVYPGAELASGGATTFSQGGAGNGGGGGVPPQPPPTQPPPTQPPPTQPPPIQPPPSMGVDTLPQVPQPSAPGDIVGLVLQNTQATSLGARLITFGEEFAAGQVPAGSHLVAMIGGHAVAVQMDVLATNADGSVRMADISLEQPALAAGSSTGVMLALAPSGPSGAPVDLSALAGHGFNLTVDLGLHNADGSVTADHVDVGSLLTAALKAGTVSYWLQGPLVTEARVDVPVAGSLHLTFDIRAYADGTTQTDVQFNNDLALGPTGGDVTYDATIKQNGATVLQQSNITEYQYQSWNQEVYSNGAPQVNVQHDVAALEKTGAVPNYDLTTGVADSTIQGNYAQLGGAGFGILGNAGLTMYMGTTGERADIGPATDPSTQWLLTQNQQAGAYALAQADATGSIPWHYYDAAIGTYANTDATPNLWTDPRGGSSGGSTGLTQQVTQNSGWGIDFAHQPNAAYDAYLMTGERYYLDQVNAQATADVVSDYPAYRNGGQGILLNSSDQVRAQAWSINEIDNAAFINPDNSPLKTYFQQVQARNFAAAIQSEQTVNEGQAYGYAKGGYGSTPFQSAPWQQDFLGIVVGQAAEQGAPGASAYLAWQTNFLAGRFDSAALGFDPNQGDVYALDTVDPATGISYQTWAEIMNATQAGGQAQGTPFATYMESARASLSVAITNNQSPQAIQAFGWVSKYYTEANTAAFQASPKYDIAPRLSDGQLLTGDNIHISNDTIASTLQYGNADQLVYAGSGNDTVIGGTGINILFAGSGNDILLGGAGTDYLFGGSGASRLSGGAGTNYLQSGTGATSFALTDSDVAHDTIAGFRTGVDTLNLFATPGVAMPNAQVAGLIANVTRDSAGDAVLHLSPTHDVTLLGVMPAQLMAGMFS